LGLCSILSLLGKIGSGTLSTIIAPETHIFSKATLLMGVRIAQNFLGSQIFWNLPILVIGKQTPK
jgi:hypothetical protein